MKVNALCVCAVLMETMDSLHQSDRPACLCCVSGEDDGLLYIRVIGLHVCAVFQAGQTQVGDDSGRGNDGLGQRGDREAVCTHPAGDGEGETCPLRVADTRHDDVSLRPSAPLCSRRHPVTTAGTLL